MNETGKIYITISDTRGVGSSQISSLNSQVVEQPNKSQTKAGEMFNQWANDKVMSTVSNTAKTLVEYSLANIGNFTGDYITQVRVNEAKKQYDIFKQIGLSAVSGFAVGGVAGALVMAGIGLVNSGVSSALDINTNMVMNHKTNYEIEQLRRRAGLSSLNDGSRGAGV